MQPIETERLRLRAFRRQDLDAFTAYRADVEVARYQGWSDYTRADADAFFEAQQALTFGELDTWYQIAIAERATDELVGDCVLHFLADRQVEIGFTLAPGHQGQGLMSEAIRALLTFAFEDLDTHRVTATTDARNRSCVALLERLGFRREGDFRQNVFFKGEWGDEFLYAMLAEEWRPAGSPLAQDPGRPASRS